MIFFITTSNGSVPMVIGFIVLQYLLQMNVVNWELEHVVVLLFMIGALLGYFVYHHGVQMPIGTRIWETLFPNGFLGQTSGGQRPNSSDIDHVIKILLKMPTEEYLSQTDIESTSIGKLREYLERRNIDSSQCVEKRELVELLQSYRGGMNNTCSICYEEYEAGDILRILKNCNHDFHLECLDRWAFSSATKKKEPLCPLCNKAME